MATPTATRITEKALLAKNALEASNIPNYTNGSNHTVEAGIMSLLYNQLDNIYPYQVAINDIASQFNPAFSTVNIKTQSDIDNIFSNTVSTDPLVNYIRCFFSYYMANTYEQAGVEANSMLPTFINEDINLSNPLPSYFDTFPSNITSEVLKSDFVQLIYADAVFGISIDANGNAVLSPQLQDAQKKAIIDFGIQLDPSGNVIQNAKNTEIIIKLEMSGYYYFTWFAGTNWFSS
jgi:hypothetical protein